MLKNPEEIRKIWIDVQENKVKLESCDMHNFSIDITTEQNNKTLLRKWKCSKCGGKVDSVAKIWYERGLKDGSTKK